MALYAIADTHLSFGTDKPMDSFPGWSDYTARLAANWRHLVEPQDTVVIAGDISWAMKFSECTADFAFLNDLPGQKILLKGNHDYWWNTKRKMDLYLQENHFDTLQILHNQAIPYGDVALCGSRGYGSKQSDKGETLDAAGFRQTKSGERHAEVAIYPARKKVGSRLGLRPLLAR